MSQEEEGVKPKMSLANFDSLPPKISEKILKLLPLESKKQGRRVCKNWNQILLSHFVFRIPDFNDINAKLIATFTHDITELTITSLTHPISDTINFFNGHRIRKLIFEDPEVTEDNMIWLMTKCYSIKEIQIKQKESTRENFEKLVSFLRSKNTRVMNMASRTLKSLLIIGQRANGIEETKLSFDCSILRDCASLQSFIIINLPNLELRNIQQLPSSLAHLAIEEDGGGEREEDDEEKVRENDDESPSRSKLLVSLGFIDFSSPIPLPVKTFQYVIRLTRLRRLTNSPLSGQKLLDSCQNARMFSALWNSEVNHYKVRTGYRTIQSIAR